MDKLSNHLYFGFWLGVVLSAAIFTYILVNHYTANNFLKQNNIYLDGAYYKLCKRSCK